MILRRFRRHQQFHRLMTDAVSGALPADARARLETHLAGCAACRERFAEEQRLVQLLRSAPLLQPSRSLRLTPAMIGRPRPGRQVPAPVLLVTRAAAAASVALFAVVASLNLLASDDPGAASRAEKGAELTTLGAGDIAEPPAAASESTASAEPEPGVAPAPGSGASGAGVTPGAPAPAPDDATRVAGGDTPIDDTSTPDGDDLRRLAGNPEPELTAYRDSDGPGTASRWPVAATGGLALASLAALAALEITRRRRA